MAKDKEKRDGDNVFPLTDPTATKTVPFSGATGPTGQPGTPGVPAKPAKKPRRMSSGLQVMARIERLLADLDAPTANRVIMWVKSLPLQPESKDASTGT